MIAGNLSKGQGALKEEAAPMHLLLPQTANSFVNFPNKVYGIEK